MYAVTCSACRAVEKSPFARVGAAMRCPACGAVAPLRQEDIKHHVRLKLEGDEELFKVAAPPPAPTGGAVPPPPPAPTPLELLSTTVDEQVSLVTPSAPEPEPAHSDASLQLAAEAERIAEAARRRRPPAGRPPGSEPAISGAEMAARLALQRKRKTFTAVVLMTLLVLAGVAGAVLLTMGGNRGEPSNGGDAVATDNPGNGGVRDPNGTDPRPPVKPADPVNPPVKPPVDPIKPPVDPVTPQPPIVPSILRVTADPLPGDAWQPAASAFRPESGDAAVALTDEVRTETAAGLVFTANLVSRTAVSSALLTVFLVNDEDRVYARLEHPAVLIEDRKPRPVRFVIPPAMRAGLSTLHCSLQSLDAGVKNLVVYEDGLVEPLAGEEQVLKISAFNGSDTALKQSVFALQLLDAEGYALQQWRLPYSRPAKGRDWVKFEAKLPIKLPAGAKWRVFGAGLSDAAAVVPPPVKPPDTPGPDPNERELPRPRGGGKGLFDF